jgi:hypothetical protein
MNIIDLQEDLKDLPDRRLMQEMQMPTGNMPQFLVLGELQRRKRMRDDYKRQEAADMPTVAEEMITGAGVPQGGLMAMAGAMAPKTNVAQDTGIDQAMPMQATRAPQQPQMMSTGGITSIANLPEQIQAGRVSLVGGARPGVGFRSGTTTSAIANLKVNFPDIYNEVKDDPLLLEEIALAKLAPAVEPDESFAEDIGTFDFTDKAAPFKPTASMFKMDDSGTRGIDNRLGDSLKRFEQSFLADTFLNDTDPNSLMYAPAQPGQYKYQGTMFTLNPDGTMVSETGIPVGEEGKAAILAANLPKVPIPNYGEKDELPVGAVEQDFASLIADDSDGTPVDPLDIYNLPQSIIDARKADSPDVSSESILQPRPEDVIDSLFENVNLPPVSMPDSVLPDRQQDADVPFGAVLGVPTTPEGQIQSYEGADLASADETPEEAQARIDAQIERDGYIAAAEAEANRISDANREASRDMPNQFPLFTSNTLPSEFEQSAAPPAKLGEYGLGIPDILADLKPTGRLDQDTLDLIPPEIRDQISTQIDTLQEGAGLIMDNAGVVGDVIKDTIEMQKLRSEAKTERDGYVAAARAEVEAEAAAKDAANLKEDLDRSLKTGKNTSESALQKALASRQKARDQSFWLDVARAGAKMAQSKNPTLIGAAAEGIETFADSRAKARKQALDYEVAMARIDAAAKKGTTLTLNQRIQALQKERERLEEKLLLMGDDERLKFPLERRIAAISAAIAPYTGMSAMSTGNQPVKIS